MANNNATKSVPVRLNLSNVVIQFPVLTEAKKQERGDSKFSMQLTMPKGSELHSQLRTAIWECIQKNHLEEAQKKPGFRIPLRDGDATGKDYNRGMMISSGSSRRPIAVVDSRNRLLTEDEIGAIWGGSRCNVAIALVPYRMQGNEGIAVYVNAIQLIENSHRDAVDPCSYFSAIEAPCSENPISFTPADELPF